jgi:hypothetical protein
MVIRMKQFFRLNPFITLGILKVIKSRRLRWSGHVARMEKGRSAFKILTDKTTITWLLGRPRRR